MIECERVVTPHLLSASCDQSHADELVDAYETLRNYPSQNHGRLQVAIDASLLTLVQLRGNLSMYWTGVKYSTPLQSMNFCERAITSAPPFRILGTIMQMKWWMHTSPTELCFAES